MCKFEPSQKEESRALPADSAKAYSKFFLFAVDKEPNCFSEICIVSRRWPKK